MVPICLTHVRVIADSLWLHVRAVGEWTNRLYDYFEKEQERMQAEEAVTSSTPAVPADPEVGRSEAGGRGSMSYNGNSMQMRGKGLKRLQASIQRKLGSDEEGTNNRTGSIKSVGFRKVGGDGFTNEGFSYGGPEGRGGDPAGLATLMQGTILDSVGVGAGNEGNGVDSARLTSGGSVGAGSVGRGRKLSPDQKLHRLLLAGSKIPLAKSLSMPDMQTRTKKRERLMA
ncbi:hypothetical protein J437_LFUL000522 [Ladona fulva]|uniref:Uncharacterized protein n=1 Tax=Ladona fulva TaxID=123851 RepID=A0A8K0NU48_LADFU|nr:hypothetical protein J437_LFUL000522 [Ladona fulva]